MNESTAAQSLWIGDDSTTPARERLRKTVSVLKRARYLQVLLDHSFAGLLAGLGLATLAVLAARHLPLGYPPSQLALAAVSVALAVALVVGWQRRPNALDVAIQADLALKLKQRLSTAWEYMSVHGDSVLADRLAVQAVKAGLPIHARLVFPLRVNRWGQLAPLAAIALLFASVLDLNWMQMPAPRVVDERVVNEGQRLSAFSKELQVRARREDLPRSAKQADRFERLGARMESGALSRNEALGMLRQLGKSLDEELAQALAGQDAKRSAVPRPDGVAGSRSTPGQNSAQMLERMSRGTLDRNSTEALKQFLDSTARSGVSRPRAEEALRRHQAGDNQAVREILEQLAKIERERRDQEELENAREQLRQAQENLGEPRAGSVAGLGLANADGESDNQDDDHAANPGANRRLSGESSRGASRYGAQGSTGDATERQRAAAPRESGKSDPILKPQGQMREGEELVTQGQVLPRPGRPTVENLPIRAEFASQVENVLSNEQYPAHSKEFIRRYFLNLSRGAQIPQQQTQGAQ